MSGPTEQAGMSPEQRAELWRAIIGVARLTLECRTSPSVSHAWRILPAGLHSGTQAEVRRQIDRAQRITRGYLADRIAGLLIERTRAGDENAFVRQAVEAATRQAVNELCAPEGILAVAGPDGDEIEF